MIKDFKHIQKVSVTRKPMVIPKEPDILTQYFRNKSWMS